MEKYVDFNPLDLKVNVRVFFLHKSLNVSEGVK